MENYEAMRSEIKRLHDLCRTKNELLAESRQQLGIYRSFFAGKISEERRRDIDKLIQEINYQLE